MCPRNWMFQTFYWNEIIVQFSLSQSYYVWGPVLLMLFPVILSNMNVEFSSLKNEIKVVMGHKPTMQRGIIESTKQKSHLPSQLPMEWPILKEHSHHGVLPSWILGLLLTSNFTNSPKYASQHGANVLSVPTSFCYFKPWGLRYAH